MERYLRRARSDSEADEYLAGLEARHLLLSEKTGEGTITDLLVSDGQSRPEVELEGIESAAFASTLEGMSSIGLIGGLSYVGQGADDPMDESKAAALLEVIAHDPERVGFDVVTDPTDPRCGMFRVSQPQRVITIRKPAVG